jgi:VWFA-related protein
MKLARFFFSLAAVSLALHAQAPPPTPTQSRLLCLYFDLNSMDAAAQATALENASKFVQEQTTPTDRISVMTFGSKVNVLQDFTADHESVLAVLRMIMPATGTANAMTELQGLQTALSALAPLPQKKAMLYFSSGLRRDTAGQDELRATVDAAVRANVAIYSVDSRGLGIPPLQR